MAARLAAAVPVLLWLGERAGLEEGARLGVAMAEADALSAAEPLAASGVAVAGAGEAVPSAPVRVPRLEGESEATGVLLREAAPVGE